MVFPCKSITIKPVVDGLDNGILRASGQGFPISPTPNLRVTGPSQLSNLVVREAVFIFTVLQMSMPIHGYMPYRKQMPAQGEKHMFLRSVSICLKTGRETLEAIKKKHMFFRKQPIICSYRSL